MTAPSNLVFISAVLGKHKAVHIARNSGGIYTRRLELGSINLMP